MNPSEASVRQFFTSPQQKEQKFYITQATAICRNPHNLSNWHSRITRQLVYKHTFCQNVVSTNNWLSLQLCENKTCFIVGLLRVGHVFPLSFKFSGLKTQLIICVLSYVISNTSRILLIGKKLDGKWIKKDVGGKNSGGLIWRSTSMFVFRELRCLTAMPWQHFLVVYL